MCGVEEFVVGLVPDIECGSEKFLLISILILG